MTYKELKEGAKKLGLTYGDKELHDKHVAALMEQYWEGMKQVTGMAEYIVVLESILKRNNIEFPQKTFSMVEDRREFVNTYAEFCLGWKGGEKV